MKGSFMISSRIVFSMVASLSLVHALQAIDTSTSSTVNVAQKSAHAHKILTHPNMKMLDTVFCNDPMPLLRITLSTKVIKKVLHELPSIIQASSSADSERYYVATKIDELLKPVATFFAHIDTNKSFVKFLILESLGESSLLLKYAQFPGSITEFCSQKITSYTTLRDFVIELQQFFGDIETSLSKETQAAYRTQVAALKHKK